MAPRIVFCCWISRRLWPWDKYQVQKACLLYKRTNILFQSFCLGQTLKRYCFWSHNDLTPDTSICDSFGFPVLVAYLLLPSSLFPLLVCFLQTVENVYDPLIYPRCRAVTSTLLINPTRKPPATSRSQGPSASQQIPTEDGKCLVLMCLYFKWRGESGFCVPLFSPVCLPVDRSTYQQVQSEEKMCESSRCKWENNMGRVHATRTSSYPLACHTPKAKHYVTPRLINKLTRSPSAVRWHHMRPKPFPFTRLYLNLSTWLEFWASGVITGS